MESTEEFSVCLNNEALLRVRLYLYKPFYSRKRENAKLRGTKLSENREKMKHGEKPIFKKNKGTGTSWKGLYYRYKNKHHNYKTIKLDLFKKNILPNLQRVTASLQSDCPSLSEKDVTQVHFLN